MAKKAKRRVVPFHELQPFALAEAAREGTDLACALIGGAYIENATGTLLEKVMINAPQTDALLNSPVGALSTASVRADMCYCLGLIDQNTWANSKRISQIRNRFAHSHVPVGFDDSEVKELCKGFRLSLIDLDGETGKPLDLRRIASVPRYHFVVAAIAAWTEILMATASQPIENEKGEITHRQRKRPRVHEGGIGIPNIKSKSIFDSVILFDD